MDTAIDELVDDVGCQRTAACKLVGRSRASHYRARNPVSPAPRSVKAPKAQLRALSQAEAAAVLDTLHSQRFVDLAPAAVYATLLDEGVYLCSVPTMYRLLRARGESRERRAQAVHPAAVKPELIATAPNDVWSWDITKLHGPAKVGSAWGAVPGLLPVRFPRPPAEPAVRVSTQRALHVSYPMITPRLP